MLTAILFILMLLVLIIPHEWGHMIVAKMCGVRVFEFSVGMGPLLFHTTRGETEYSVRLLPLGGFCKLEGEDEASEEPTAYNNQPERKKIAILLAGVTMNILIAILAVTIMVCITGIDTNTVDVIKAGSPAEASELQTGDTIVAVNGEDMSSWNELTNTIRSYKDGDEPLVMTYERDGKRYETSITPEFDKTQGVYMIGVSTKPDKNIVHCIAKGPATTWDLSKTLFRGIYMLIAGQASPKDVAGPIGLVKVVDESQDYGVSGYLLLLAFVSLNLAFFNLIPIPGLDGGKIFFIFLRWISRGKITDEIEYKATVVGILFLFIMIFVVTINDLNNLFG